MGLQFPSRSYKILRLDRRYTGYDFFQYAIDLKYSSQKFMSLIEYRNWFWNNYGPSLEWGYFNKVVFDLKYQHALEKKMISDVWCWQTEHNQCRIFIKNETILSHFILTFG